MNHAKGVQEPRVTKLTRDRHWRDTTRLQRGHPADHANDGRTGNLCGRSTSTNCRCGTNLLIPPSRTSTANSSARSKYWSPPPPRAAQSSVPCAASSCCTKAVLLRASSWLVGDPVVVGGASAFVAASGGGTEHSQPATRGLAPPPPSPGPPLGPARASKVCGLSETGPGFSGTSPSRTDEPSFTWSGVPVLRWDART